MVLPQAKKILRHPLSQSAPIDSLYRQSQIESGPVKTTKENDFLLNVPLQ